MSILSSIPDGCGFFYGYVKGDLRRIDVRMSDFRRWKAFVGGEALPVEYRSKGDAERAAVMWIENNPEPALAE